MRGNYVIAALVVLALSMICLMGCERTPDASASSERQCEMTADAATGGATCASAAEGCPGTCPSMMGTEVADADANTAACAYHKEGTGCESECTCPAHDGSDGSMKCAHAVKDADGKMTCQHAVKDADGSVTCGCAHASAKTGTGKCPMSDGAVKSCPHASSDESS
ncbi:MAG: hypothetical protein ABIG03_01950 [Candidatus Eisenbacteria bacterium]